MITKQFESEKEALGAARNTLENFAACGPWMAVVFKVEAGEVVATRVSWEFPKAKSGVVREEFSKLMGELEVGVEQMDPLPMASLETALHAPSLDALGQDEIAASTEKLTEPQNIQPPEDVLASPDELRGEIAVENQSHQQQ